MKIALYLTDNKRRHDGVTTFLHETLKATKTDSADVQPAFARYARKYALPASTGDTTA